MSLGWVLTHPQWSGERPIGFAVRPTPPRVMLQFFSIANRFARGKLMGFGKGKERTGKPRWLQWDSDKPEPLPGWQKELKRRAEGGPVKNTPTPPKPVVLKAPKPRKWKYEEYMQSPEWADFRNRWFTQTNFPKQCVACNVTTGLELHHVTYERLGFERMNDVVPLCRRCHKEFHERFTSHQCSGLEEFRRQLCIAFRLEKVVAKIRLRPFFDFNFMPGQRKQQTAKRIEQENLTRAQKRAVKKLKGAVAYQRYHDRHSPRRHDPLA